MDEEERAAITRLTKGEQPQPLPGRLQVQICPEFVGIVAIGAVGVCAALAQVWMMAGACAFAILLVVFKK